MDTFYKDGQGNDVIDKRPGAEKNYTFDWTDWLPQGHLIDTATITVDTGSELVKGAVTKTGTLVDVMVSGGTLNKVGKVSCEITTTGTPSLKDVRSFLIKMVA